MDGKYEQGLISSLPLSSLRCVFLIMSCLCQNLQFSFPIIYALLKTHPNPWTSRELREVLGHSKSSANTAGRLCVTSGSSKWHRDRNTPPHPRDSLDDPMGPLRGLWLPSLTRSICPNSLGSELVAPDCLSFCRNSLPLLWRLHLPSDGNSQGTQDSWRAEHRPPVPGLFVLFFMLIYFRTIAHQLP